ncbi:MAG: hypothetical protein OSB57_15030, partial [Planctomycetota bacterium]|nr:hypothetical protein [Planctomycetota bacterium]
GKSRCRTMWSVKMPANRNAGFDSARCKVWHWAAPHSKAATVAVRIAFRNMMFLIFNLYELYRGVSHS